VNWGGKGVGARRVNGCLYNGVIRVWQVETEASTSVEGWVKGSGVNGFHDIPGHLIGFSIQVCNVLHVEVIA
jgi:hypothetical protein